MKALSLRQPWATLAMLGIKRVENRSWPAPAALIGQRLAIHASAAACDIRSWREVPAVRDLIYLPALATLPKAAILGTVELSACVRDVDLPEEFAAHPFAGVDCWCWLLAKPRLLVRPFACKGALRLWDAPADARLED